jgi:hypothetical protein
MYGMSEEEAVKLQIIADRVNDGGPLALAASLRLTRASYIVTWSIDQDMLAVIDEAIDAADAGMVSLRRAGDDLL